MKCRKNAAGLITETSVPPLPNEGVVAFVDAPLKGALNELHPGQRVLITEGQALTESICGTDYLCIRHDYCQAVYVPVFSDEVIDASIVGVIESIKQNTFTKEFQRLPLDKPSNNT